MSESTTTQAALREKLAKSRAREVLEFDGAKVEVRSLRLTERVQVAQALEAANRLEGEAKIAAQAEVGALLFALCTYDPESGTRIYANGTAAEVDQLDGEMVDRVATAALRVSGLTKSASEDAKNVSGASAETSTASSAKSEE